MEGRDELVDAHMGPRYHWLMVTPTKTRLTMKVADEVWVATALLHRENPARPDFSAKEITERAASEHPSEPVRPGVYVHALQHCVANIPPNTGKYRMLYETGRGRRRLFRPGDSFHPLRSAGKTTPAPEELPDAYLDLLEWYREWSGQGTEPDPLLALAGSGRALWADEPADAYVRRLREGWE